MRTDKLLSRFGGNSTFWSNQIVANINHGKKNNLSLEAIERTPTSFNISNAFYLQVQVEV